MDLTLDELRQVLAGMRINVPDFLLQIWLNKVNAINACLIGAGVSDDDGKLIKLYLLTLFGIGQAWPMVQSESAPSGASRSFRFGDLRTQWATNLNALRLLDKTGCAGELIPVDPTVTARAGLWVATGGCNDDCGPGYV